jgi:hypothetical protein
MRLLIFITVIFFLAFTGNGDRAAGPDTTVGKETDLLFKTTTSASDSTGRGG